MPVERVSKGFADLSMTFQINPINYDLITLKNETAIARSIRNIVLTHRGERFFNQEFGCDASHYLFNTIDEFTANDVERKITTSIQIHEPRVRVNFVTVIANELENALNVTINYTIIGINATPQELSFALQSAR